MHNTEAITQSLRTLLEQMVEKPEAVKVSCVPDPELGHDWLFVVEVDASDQGRVIGKGGRTAQSLRVLLRVVGKNWQKKLRLELQG